MHVRGASTQNVRHTTKAISYAVGFRQSKTAVFDWTFLDWGFLWSFFLSSIEAILYEVVFVLSLEAVGVREYCCMYSSQNWLAALCFDLSPRATTRRTLVPASWWLWAKPKAAKATFVKLHSAESCQSYSSRSRCWQH